MGYVNGESCGGDPGGARKGPSEAGGVRRLDRGSPRRPIFRMYGTSSSCLPLPTFYILRDALPPLQARHRPDSTTSGVSGCPPAVIVGSARASEEHRMPTGDGLRSGENRDRGHHRVHSNGISQRCREEGDVRMTWSSFPLPGLFPSLDEGCPAAQAVLFPLYPVISDR